MFKGEFVFQRIMLVVVCLIASTISFAQSSGDAVQLHGFGEWAYGRTDGNSYLGGSEEGDYDQVGLALNVSSEISDKVSVVGQIAVRTHAGEDPAAALDYAFARWKLNDSLQVRVGRSKHPFGIYTEIFDVGTLRPFFHLPQSIYGPSEIAAQAYDGVGLTGTHAIGKNMALDFDVYAGEIGFGNLQRVEEVDDDAGERVRDILGARVRLSTPIEGLGVGAVRSALYFFAWNDDLIHRRAEIPRSARRGISATKQSKETTQQRAALLRTA